MESDLRDALRARPGDDPTPLEREYLELALSARARGRAVLDRVERSLIVESLSWTSRSRPDR